MAKNMTVTTAEGQGNQQVVLQDDEPNVCPICHVTIEPQYLGGVQAVRHSDWLEIYFRCANRRCRRHFTAIYRFIPGNSTPPHYAFNRCDPEEPLVPEFDKTVKDLSPGFLEVYGQAVSAEAHGLAAIAGPGFRKALEFLVKDYAISLVPEASEDIKKIQLAKVIEKYLKGDKLSVVSSRAAWLGNDETHYERRWMGKDLKDLKKLIAATVHFVAMERLVADLPEEMPRTGPA